MSFTRRLVLIWLSWALIVIGFQAWATARLEPVFPDRAQEWTERFTDSGYQQGHVYLLEPFMNHQVAWDSEYYLSIAVGGYDDPRSPQLTPEGIVTLPEGVESAGLGPGHGSSISSNYAFFPLYPLLIRLFAYPLQVFGMNQIATATLAGISVSALGTLFGSLALFDLAREGLGEAGALRAVFFLLIFPTGFFLVQVYSEGLFVGLAFGCLAMMKRRQWLAAGLLAAAATLTRAVGIALVVPLLIDLLRTDEWVDIVRAWRGRAIKNAPFRPILNMVFTLLPVFTFLLWKFSHLGAAFNHIQTHVYGRGALKLGNAFFEWSRALGSMLNGGNPQHTAYYFTEFLGLALALLACAAMLRRFPELAWFSFLVVLISWGSGPAQSFHRYILGAPAVFLALGHWGSSPVFERAWTMLSLMLMGFLAALFAFNLWVA